MSIPINPNIIDDDEALMHLSKKNDKKAFSIIYNKYHQYLYALAYRYLKDSDMAEDAVQHVYVKLWEVMHVIDIEINLKNYLYSMTKNHILNQFRSNKEMISISVLNAQQEIVDDEPDIVSVIEDAELSDLLQIGIENLPKQKKEIVRMKIEENKSNQEIADEMGLSINTVKSHYQESVKMLRIYFKKIKLMFF